MTDAADAPAAIARGIAALTAAIEAARAAPANAATQAFLDGLAGDVECLCARAASARAVDLVPALQALHAAVTGLGDDLARAAGAETGA
jgi:hypothetical protein